VVDLLHGAQGDADSWIEYGGLHWWTQWRPDLVAFWDKAAVRRQR
jgi:hypothetical protein